MFEGQAEHAAYGPVLSKPFLIFESSPQLFLNSSQRHINETTKATNSAAASPTDEAAATNNNNRKNDNIRIK